MRRLKIYLFYLKENFVLNYVTKKRLEIILFWKPDKLFRLLQCNKSGFNQP